MAAITISRQLGSFGCEIGSATADLLGYRFLHRELINLAAQRAGTPEVALATIDELGLIDICPSPRACAAFRQAISQVMEEFINQGNVVIIGRAGQVILAKHPGVLHVQIIAPLVVRAERVASKFGVSMDCALAQIETSDHYRAKYLRRFYHIRWTDPSLYHMVINSQDFSIQQSAALISDALRHLLANNNHSKSGRKANLEHIK